MQENIDYISNFSFLWIGNLAEGKQQNTFETTKNRSKMEMPVIMKTERFC